MKTLDLNAYGVEEMNVNEMKETEGGCLILAFAAAFIAIGILCSKNPERVVASYAI